MNALCEVQDEINNNPKWRAAVRIALTVHDSLMWEVPVEMAEEFAAMVKRVMENPKFNHFNSLDLEMRVPLVSDVEILTERWDSVEEAA